MCKTHGAAHGAKACRGGKSEVRGLATAVPSLLGSALAMSKIRLPAIWRDAPQ